MISKSRRDSVVAELFFSQTTFGGGGSNRDFPLSSVAKSNVYPTSRDIRG